MYLSLGEGTHRPHYLLEPIDGMSRSKQQGPRAHPQRNEGRGTDSTEHPSEGTGTRVGKGYPSGDTAGPESAGERPWGASSEHTWFARPGGPEQTPLSESSPCPSAGSRSVPSGRCVCRNLNVRLRQGHEEQDALLGVQQPPGPPLTCSRAGMSAPPTCTSKLCSAPLGAVGGVDLADPPAPSGGSDLSHLFREGW